MIAGAAEHDECDEAVRVVEAVGMRMVTLILLSDASSLALE